VLPENGGAGFSLWILVLAKIIPQARQLNLSKISIKKAGGEAPSGRIEN